MTLRAGETIEIPSPIDVHVHLREPGGEDKETIESGTLAALAGGYQAVFDMPNNPGGNETWTADRIDEKIAIARRSAHTNIGFYAGVDLANPAFEQMPALVRKAAGLKLYMDHTTGNTERYDLDAVRPVIDAWINQARQSAQTPPILLHAREEIGAETAQYIAEHDYRVHWCHIATESEVADARQLSRAYPAFYTGGATPHHLTMTRRNADFQQGWNGARMQPPLGEEYDADALLRAYNDGHIQILETDHAPHTSEAKVQAESDNPSGKTLPGCTTCFGVSGIEFVLPVMMSLVQRKLTIIERVVDSLHEQPIKMLGLKKLGSTATSNTTVLTINPYTITDIDIFGKSRNTPYIGWTAWAEVMQVNRNKREVFNGVDAHKQQPVEILRAGSAL